MMRQEDQGKKRHILVDTMSVAPRDRPSCRHPDRDAILLLATLFDAAFLTKLSPTPPIKAGFHGALTKILPHLETEIVKRSDHVKICVLPKR